MPWCREILGDHGQLPTLNYLVVTAVVDKDKPFSSRFRDSRRLIEFCTSLPAISRSSLVRLAGALRTACAECTYKMEPPEPGSDDEFDQFDY